MKRVFSSVKALPRRVLALGILAVLALCMLVPATAFASSGRSAPKCSKTDVNCVITVGDTLITDRQTALTKLATKVAAELSTGHISSDQANALQADITTNQTGLTTLKTKLDQETDVKAARDDVKNVYVQFRIFAVVLPRDHRQLHIDQLVQLDAKLKGLENQLQQQISAAPAAKQVQLNKLYTDFKTQLTNAESQIDTAQADFPALTPVNFNTDHTTFETTLKNLSQAEQTAHTDLHQAAKDYHQIAQLLKKK